MDMDGVGTGVKARNVTAEVQIMEEMWSVVHNTGRKLTDGSRLL